MTCESLHSRWPPGEQYLLTYLGGLASSDALLRLAKRPECFWIPFG